MEKQINLKRTILWVIVGVLALLVVYVLFFSGSASGNTVQAGQVTGQIASSGMVGGC